MAHPTDRAFAALPSSPSVSPVPASIPCAPWFRVRFAVYEQEPGELDSRPIKFPPPGPYWISGQGQGCDDAYYDILIAFVPNMPTLLEYWPDADLEWSGCDIQPREEITFSDRFPKPRWWQAGGSHDRMAAVNGARDEDLAALIGPAA